MKPLFKNLMTALIILASFGAQGSFASASTPSIDAAYNNRMIDDNVFANTDTMSAQDIQNFLNSKVPSCDTNHQGGLSQYPPPYTCLKDYVDPTTGKRAAQLIYDESQSRGLNPQVILATLEKEQGLVTDTWPYPIQYKSAMGYGCPESQSVCDSQYYGFFNQVHLGATLLRVGLDRDCGNSYSFPGWYVNPQWQQGNSPSVDGVSTHLDNCATGSMYNYTPHRPDSAYTSRGGTYYYGNYNFVNYFSNWFGSTLYNGPAYAHPDGTLVRQVSEATVYSVANGIRYPFPSAQVFLSHGLNFGQVKLATPGDAALPIGSALGFRVGSLVRGSSPTVYMVDTLQNGTYQKHPISSLSVFQSLGYDSSEVFDVSDSSLPPQDGAAISDAQQHPSGSLIRSANDPSVYLITGNLRYPIPSPAVFSSYGYRWDRIKTSTNQDMQVPLAGPLGFRSGFIIKGSSPAVYVTSSGGKRAFPSAYSFLGLGYKWSDIFGAPDSQLPIGNDPNVGS